LSQITRLTDGQTDRRTSQQSQYFFRKNSLNRRLGEHGLLAPPFVYALISGSLEKENRTQPNLFMFFFKYEPMSDSATPLLKSIAGLATRL